MESGNGGASSKGVLIPVSDSLEVCRSSILAPLQSSYLYEESKQFFRYKSILLVKNPELEKKYNAFREKKRNAGYSENELEESYGFLLFDDINKANALGETGVLTGNSTCTTLGDPSKGVYISVYSDCLDLNRWYHGKSGYIAIIKLTKGMVKKVVENYTQNFTEPTVGFDCHMSEQLPSVSAKTSSFLAFERTQHYIYELLDDGSNGTALSPSSVCPFAIVSFSYTDTKEAPHGPEETSEVKKVGCHYLQWKGQLQIDSQLYAVELRSTAGAFVPVELPPVLKIDKVISLSDLRKLLPKAVFENCYTEEVFLDGFYCSLFKFEGEETSAFALLLCEIKEKDLALAIPLNDGGFLILLHSSHFFTYHDNGSSGTEVLQGVFLFPYSRVVRRDPKIAWKKPPMSPEILQVLPALSYAETEVEKTPMDPSEKLCEVLAQHIQSYATLINPGLVISPSREVSIFPDQYDIADAHKHLYSVPEWTNVGWQSIKSYLSKPDSFQLPVSKVSEILVAGSEERREDLVDDVYICLSSPEEAPASPISMGVEDKLLDQRPPVNVETPVDIDMPSVASQVNPIVVSQNVVPDVLQVGDPTKDSEKSNDLSELDKMNDVGANGVLTPPPSEDLSTELIVSITSAEQSVTDETLSDVSAVSATKGSGLPFSGFSTRTRLQTTELNSLCDETDKTKPILNSSEVTNGKGAKPRKLRRGFSKAQKSVTKACVEAQALQSVTAPLEVVSLNCQMDECGKELDSSHASKPLKANWRKFQRRKRKFGKLSSKNKKVTSAAVSVARVKKPEPGHYTLKNTILQELETFRLKKKTERWDLKPVISECGRILVPHGFLDIAHRVQSLKIKILSIKKGDQCHEEMMLGAPANAANSLEMEQKTSTASEMAVNETEGTKSMDGANHVQSVIDDNSDQSALRQSEDGSGSMPLTLETNAASSKNDDTDTPPPQAAQEKQTEPVGPVKSATKGEFLLSRLKSVLSRRKRKPALPTTAENAAQDTALCLKKAKVDSDIGAVKCLNATTPSTDCGIGNVSKELTVDPVFAYALGLTPISSQVKAQRTEAQDTQQRKDSETQEHTPIDGKHQIMQRPPSIFPKRIRIKTLKKHQGISTENVKKKWWLHFQTPACFASENLKFNDCTTDISVRKTVEEKMKSACSSTDALNLLADLALGANNDMVPPQPSPALWRKPETSLKKCDLTKGLTRAEQESVLHALLRQPAAKFIQPLESPSPSPLVGDSDLVGLVTTEHAYSLPPSSSLLLGLPGTPFHVTPLSGSTRLLHHHQTMYGDGVKTLHPCVIQEDIGENNRTSDYLHRHKRKFRHSRTFVMKEGSVQVTKEWKENYDFNLDSRLASDQKDKVVIRALHGPWDLSIQDTCEEARLIFHMWIGLFYSRSTDRFFQGDSSPTCPMSMGSDSFQMADGMVSGPLRPGLRTNPSASLSSETNTSAPLFSKALDLSIKDISAIEPESEILDLSLRNSYAQPVSSGPQVNRKVSFLSNDETERFEKLHSFKSPAELQEASTSEPSLPCQTSGNMVDSLFFLDAFQKWEKESTRENYRPIPEKAVCLEHTDAASFTGDRTVIPLEEAMQSAPVEQETVPIALGIGEMLQGPNKEITDKEDGLENSDATEKILALKDGMDLSKSATDKETDFSMEEDDVVNAEEHNKQEPKVEKSCEMKNNPCTEMSVAPSLEVIHTNDDSANRESDIICTGNDFENKKLLSREECTALSSDQTADMNGDVDCSTTCEGTELKHEDRLRGNGLDEKQSCISAVEVDSDSRDQRLDETCDDPVKEDCISECSHQAQMDELPLAESTKDACTNLCANPITPTPECPNVAVSNTPDTPAEIKIKSVAEEKLEGISPVDETHGPSLSSSMSEHTCLVDVPESDWSSPQTENSAETVNKDMFLELNGNRDEGQETKSTEVEITTDKTTLRELFQHQSRSPQCDVLDKCEAGLSFSEETEFATDETNEEQDKSWSGVVIPFIGRDISGMHAVQPQDNVEDTFQGQEAIPFISETANPVAVLPNVLDCMSQISGEKVEPFSHKIPLLDVSETHDPVVLGNVFDNRCPTPTLDEKPFEHMSSSSPSSGTPAFRTQKCPNKNSTPVNDDPPLEQKLQTPTVNTNPSPHPGLHPDLELRTLRVLQSIGKYLSKSNHMDTLSQIEIADKKHLDQNPNSCKKSTPIYLAPGQTQVDFKNKKIVNEKLTVTPSSDTRDLRTQSSDNFLSSTYKNESANVLDVKLQLKNTNSLIHPHNFESADKREMSVGPHCHSSRPFVSTEALQDEHKTSQPNLNPESQPQSQRPVMAVKPSQSDDSQAHCLYKDLDVDTASLTKRIHALLAKCAAPHSMTKAFKENSDELNVNHSTQELSLKPAVLPNAICSKSNSNGDGFAHLDPAHQHQEANISKFNTGPSSLPPSVETFESAEGYPELMDENKDVLRCGLNDTEQTTRNTSQKDCSHKSSMFPKDESRSEDGDIVGPQGSLTCTIFNHSRKRSRTLLEQLSQRCLQEDLTQASLEQECLIFSEQMKNLLKKTKRRPICRQDANDDLRLSCTSPVTVNFSCLEEQEDSLDFMDTSLVGQKIKVEMPNRKDETEGEKTLHAQGPSQGVANPLEHAGISGVTAECTKLYEAKMQDVCSFRKVPSRHKRLRKDRSCPRTKPSNHFDFCDQMKKELDETFRSNLNAVVKKSCRRRYRFHMLMTSDDAFFEKTKAHLEAEGHTAVQPSEFFLAEDSSSSLLIILRNEDIAEHIIEVPHLLKLKLSPEVQFAGIDEPDDVVNLTHQELFTRGGFIMVDRAVLEPLSLCNMKRLSEILEELCGMGKWKWILHYRDSRRLKENARLSAEANEKKQLFLWGQDVGILEVLPYHECDLMSKDQPDYLSCLLRLQIQNISYRYSVFITDTTTDRAFQRNGILTVTLNDFLTKSPGEMLSN
ncbi:uncharacterized protein tasor2 isoform 2-T2 [Odontesthes bonariensis]|uniref:uncharacterized protein tasor2 isoform X2 n=1 Tax=Odontesthes bonariensis TaxID=219752 RepID=UPI003F58B613